MLFEFFLQFFDFGLGDGVNRITKTADDRQLIKKTACYFLTRAVFLCFDGFFVLNYFASSAVSIGSSSFVCEPRISLIFSERRFFNSSVKSLSRNMYSI